MMMSRVKHYCRIALPIVMATMAACGSDKATGPGGNLSAAERQGLQTLMANPNFVNALLSGSAAGGYGAAMLPFAAMNLRSVGTISLGPAASTNLVPGTGAPRTQLGVGSNYRAFGAQYVFTIKAPGVVGEQSMAWTGVIALNDLANPTDVITAGVMQTGTSTAPTSIPARAMGGSGTTIGYGSYMKISGQTVTAYASTSGNIEFSKISLSGNTNCPGMSANPFIKVCSFGNGTLQGKFNFAAKQTNGSLTVNVPETPVNIPAVLVKISLDATSVL